MNGKFAVLAAALCGLGVLRAPAAEVAVPAGSIGRLDHVFVLILENRTDTDILGNPSAPFLNAYARRASRASNYFAVGHPSAPNYLAIVGGSNFGLTSDAAPGWAEGGCVDHAAGARSCRETFAPIGAAGRDHALVATATDPGQCNGEVPRAAVPATRNCALRDLPEANYTPRSIAHQLVAQGRSWKAYEESLPPAGAQGVNYADGQRSNLSPAEALQGLPLAHLYVVKHNPFAYFRDIELGADPRLSLAREAGFDGPGGLWADLQGALPDLALIVPNQCHDMHGLGTGAPPHCRAGATAAAAAALISEGDAQVRRVVEAIEAAPAWSQGRNAIVVTWDENDFGNAANRVLFLVETSYARNGRVSDRAYDHFALLRTLEAGFGLACLNHACDAGVKVMEDLFGP
jgi:hypothetical protein